MPFQIKVISFIVASIGITWVSRASLLNVRSHGFYRFFAWEAILALVLTNLEHWFVSPFTIHQIISWLLLIISIPLVINGVQLLHKMGKPDHTRSDPALIGFEKTTELVTVGVYHYIRHPLYSSLLFLTWGVFFKNPTWLGICLAFMATFLLTLTAKIDEAENKRVFGTDYQKYMKKTKMFVPFLF